MEEVESAFHLCFDAREMRITASSAQAGLLVRKPDNFVRQCSAFSYRSHWNSATRYGKEAGGVPLMDGEESHCS